jgi:uncharacterized repeat protein (TIGR01451 family)
VRLVVPTAILILVASATPALAAPNPPWPPAQCNARVAVVLDTSSSITSAGAEQQVRDASAGLAEEMRGQSSVELGLFTFWEEAATVLPYTAMTSAGADAFVAASNVSFSSGTNWQAGFREVFNYDGSTGAHWDLPDAASPTLPDAVVFITDGKPTRWVDEVSPGVFDAVTTDDAEALAAGVVGADQFRSAGVKVAVIGVGSLDVAGLQAISGAAEFEDYWLTDFAGLAATIVEVGNKFCDPPRSDIGIAKAGSGSAVPGSDYAYTVTVDNLGPDSTASVTTVTDTLPADVTLIAASGPGWDCTASTPSAVECVLPPGFAAGASVAISVLVSVSPTAAGDIVNTVVVSNPDDFNPDNDTATAVTPVADALPVADLSVVKDDAGITAVPGETMSYSIIVANAGPDTATNVMVRDTLPSGLSVVSVVSPVGTCLDTDGEILCMIDQLVAGGEFTVTLVVEVSPFQQALIVNTATVDSPSVDDPDPTNNLDQETTPVAAVLSVTGVETQLILPLAVILLLAGLIIVRRMPVITPLRGRIPPLVSGLARFTWKPFD